MPFASFAVQTFTATPKYKITPRMLPALLSYLNDSPTAFHAALQTAEILRNAGWEERLETAPWTERPGGRFFVRRNGAVIAWRDASDEPGTAFRLLLSHLDSPGFRLKLDAAVRTAGVLAVPVERYSRTIDSTWLDRPLTLAGTAVGPDGIPRPFTFREPVAVIPNPATHINRELNDGFVYNPHQHLRALFGNLTPDDLRAAIADRAGLSSGEPLIAVDLALVSAQPAQVAGLKNDLILAPRLDNLLAAHAALTALLTTAPSHGTALAFFANHEEIGSHTAEGADAPFLRDTLERLVCTRGGTREDFFCTLARSSFLSVDAAHALHPNFDSLYDPACAPILNHGVAVKTNENGCYATSVRTAAQLAALADGAHVPLQTFRMRADKPCGSTVGPMTAARLGIPGADIGSPLWAMHSHCETAGTGDHESLIRLLEAYIRRGL